MKKNYKIKTFLLCMTISIVSIAVQAQWVNIRPGYGVTTGVMSHNGKIYSTTGGAGIYVSSDNGSTWIQQTNGLTGTGGQSKHLGKDATHIYAGTAGGVFRSNDDGNTWAATGTITSLPSICYGRYFYSFGGVTFCMMSYHSGAFNGGVYRSTDNGTTWTTSHAGIATNATPLQMANVGSDLFIGTSLGMYKSTDNGINWMLVATTPHNGLFNGLYNYNGRLIALDAHPSAGGVKYSDDGGVTWSSGTSTIRGFTLSRVLEGANDTLFAFSGGATTTASGIFYSIDSAKTWVDITGNITGTDLSSLSDMAYQNGRLYLANSTGIWSKGISSSTNEINNAQELISVFPNPFSDHIIVENAQQSEILLNVCSIDGRIVTSMRSAMAEIKINLEGISKGPYLLQISEIESGKKITSKLIIH